MPICEVCGRAKWDVESRHTECCMNTAPGWTDTPRVLSECYRLGYYRLRAALAAERHAHGLTEGERREAMRLLANALLAAHGAPALVGTCVQMTTPHTLSDHVQVYRHACEWAALAATKEKSDE